MKIVVFILGVVQILIGLLFIVEASSVQRMILGTLSFGLGSVCFGIAGIIGRLDEIRASCDGSKLR
ncbi:putative membrane protein (plasmid) [Ochrobactrum quorumnocens]|uniref:Putative membrane protein n=1 Tax=Ochrobactrum quorumnocens TaxID=271865 RepID=A0A248UNG6_9HYPH|nr:putative membrane protein [[Ochrobactrum] quorumnocens]